MVGGAGADRAELARLDMAAETSHRLSIAGALLPAAGADSVDRLAGLEDENEALRGLLLSISQLLQELRRVLELEEAAPAALDTAAAGLPAEWLYDLVKADIEESLGLISGRVAHMCGIALD